MCHILYIQALCAQETRGFDVVVMEVLDLDQLLRNQQKNDRYT